MNQGKYVFAQITKFLPCRVFDRIVEKYNGNNRIRTFTCWKQMLCRVFGQLTIYLIVGTMFSNGFTEFIVLKPILYCG